MKVLLIAPDQLGISWSSEIELLGGSVQSVPLTGTVTLERITRATAGQAFTVVHVASHGDSAGVLLSDGTVLTKERLGQIARHVRADCVFLNACNSAALGQYLACAGVPCVVCHTVAVADSDALRSASYFYEELESCSGDYKKAFDKVNPCDGSFAWFAGANYVDAAVAPLVSGVEAMRSQLVRTQQVMYVTLATLVTLVVAAVAALVVFASGVAAQGESPLPTQLPTELPTSTALSTSMELPTEPPPASPTVVVVTLEPTAGVPSGPQSTATRKRDKDEDDEEPPPTWTPSETPTVTDTAVPLSTSTPTRTPTQTFTPTPIPTVALPTLTPDYPATLTALPPC
jgi:hypothetical protein